MQRLKSPNGIHVSFRRYGGGHPLILVHGSFSDHETNWGLVEPYFASGFDTYAIARRGRGLTDRTVGHHLRNEVIDTVTVIASVGEPVYLLGHSYGALVALEAARTMPKAVRRLVLYEPPWPEAITDGKLPRLETIASTGDWDAFAASFFADCLGVDQGEIEQMRSEESIWNPILADAPASLNDLRALDRYRFRPERFESLPMPVLLQTGSESPTGLYVTDALAAVLPDSRIDQLPGQAHEGMTTAPELYAESVSRFLQ
jgi:pimeloyl-ACP methyl ester carboxylesterase